MKPILKLPPHHHTQALSSPADRTLHHPMMHQHSLEKENVSLNTSSVVHK